MRNNINNIDWNEIQKIHDSGIYWTHLPKKTNISLTLLKNAETKNLIIKK